MSKENNYTTEVKISFFVNQAKHELIGYQAFYKDEKNKFYENPNEIDKGTVSNPLIDIQQVGKALK